MAAREKKNSNASRAAYKDSRRNSTPLERTPSLEKRTKAQPETSKASDPSKADAADKALAKEKGLAKEKRHKVPASAVAQEQPLKSLTDLGKGEVETKAHPSKIRMGDAKSTAELKEAERGSKVVETKSVEMKPVSTSGKSGPNSGGTGGTMVTAPAAAIKSGTDTQATLQAPAYVSPHKLAAPKAAPASAKSDRDEQNGDQKAMKTNTNRHGFKLSEFVVYPAHGVGQIVSMEEQEVAGFKLELFVINFVKDKMTLRVPTSKVAAVGMRKLSDTDAARRSLEILTGRARVKRTMWSRRAQEYEAKINSGDINAIAEVVRDLFRSDAQPEQSYSERQLYEAALDRMMREIAAVHKLTESEALKMIEGQLKKNVKRAAKPETAGGEAETEDADIEEAA